MPLPPLPDAADAAAPPVAAALSAALVCIAALRLGASWSLTRFVLVRSTGSRRSARNASSAVPC